MYHPGKVIAIISPKDKGVISSDASIQATLRMWDDNVLTMVAEQKIAGRLREGDVVLCDYRPEKGLSVPVPRNVIVKILKGRAADKVWHEYREVHDKRKKKESHENQAQQSYIG